MRLKTHTHRVIKKWVNLGSSLLLFTCLKFHLLNKTVEQKTIFVEFLTFRINAQFQQILLSNYEFVVKTSKTQNFETTAAFHS